ncbi:MAG: FAD-dependent oxidoreductase [Gammaproteobacteria bacterium]|nr:FAD-dependent oxidoreductase [Gammaproteobacteria bacterium]
MPSQPPDYDLIIIGAGIHGAAVARAAACDGYKVCLLEQYSEAGLATSSSSSKLIHGGLRYLESFQFGLVKECLKERRILLRTAPSLVRLVPFYIPVYQNNKRPVWLIHLGLLLYRLLGGGQFRKLKQSEWPTLDGLSLQKLTAVFEYGDGLTNDKQLTQAVLQQAVNNSAVFLPQTTLKAIEIKDNMVKASTDKQTTITGRMIINASGPWVNEVLSKVSPAVSRLPIDLIQGSHIVIPRCLDKGIYYVEAADKRVVFAIPWQQHCLIGTTESQFNGPPEQCRPLAEEVDYLLATWNRYFTDDLKHGDVLQQFAGLRVLPASDKKAFKRRRDTLLHTDNTLSPRIISIYGGKLTAHRSTAAAVMAIVHRQLPGYRRTDTSELSLPA